MDANHLRRKDTTKGPPLRILSLDGGGVRGYSMLIIIQEIMYRTYVECEGKAPRRDQIPKPCDHFDLIAGTGTGGLIAIMLGRLCLDLETCKDVYIRMTRRVFETDKTFAGIPYRSTLFKASNLEDAIRACVREHTVFESEGNDGTATLTRRDNHLASPSSASLGVHRRLSRSSVGSANVTSPTSPLHSRGSSVASTVNTSSLWGNPNAHLYDSREFRTKTAVTAVYKGTPKNGTPVLLRSYDSRREPPPEFNCTIWEAGRATSATGLAFKPIQVGQHIFIDEGSGKYNPSPQILEEAAVNEWPGREVGIFVSVGTGKRPPGTNHKQHEWWEDFFTDSLGNFAEARRRLISKIEGCEITHQDMLKEHLAKRKVPKDNYYRLNVEVGVGEFGMNEWNRLVEISTNTRMYLGKNDVQKMSHDAAVKLAKIQRAHERVEPHAAAAAAGDDVPDLRYRPVPPLPTSAQQRQQQEEEGRPSSAVSQTPSYSHPPPHPPPQQPHPSESIDQPVFELPAEVPPPSPPGQKHASMQEKFTVIPSDEHPEPFHPQRPSIDQTSQNSQGRPSFASGGSPPRTSGEAGVQAPPPLPPKTPIPYPDDDTSRPSVNSSNDGNRRHGSANTSSDAVQMPVPPRMDKPTTTTNYANGDRRPAPARKDFELPYPDDRPPPAVNRMRKPRYTPRTR